MSNAASPLDTLIDLARGARDNASLALANERQTERQVSDQLSSLTQYRLEYAQRLQGAMTEGIDPATLRNYQQFLYSLDAAIERARDALSAQQQQVSNRQSQWQQEERKLTSYDTLASRRQAQQQQQDARKEMKINDDLVNGRLVRAKLSSENS